MSTETEARLGGAVLPEIIESEDGDYWFIYRHDTTDEAARVALAVYLTGDDFGALTMREASATAMTATIERCWYRPDNPDDDELMSRCEATAEGAVPFILIRESGGG